MLEDSCVTPMMFAIGKTRAGTTIVQVARNADRCAAGLQDLLVEPRKLHEDAQWLFSGDRSLGLPETGIEALVGYLILRGWNSRHARCRSVMGSYLCRVYGPEEAYVVRRGSKIPEGDKRKCKKFYFDDSICFMTLQACFQRGKIRNVKLKAAGQTKSHSFRITFGQLFLLGRNHAGIEAAAQILS